MQTTKRLEIATLTVRARSAYDVESLTMLADKTGMELKLTTTRTLFGSRVSATLTAVTPRQASVLRGLASRLV